MISAKRNHTDRFRLDRGIVPVKVRRVSEVDKHFSTSNKSCADCDEFYLPSAPTYQDYEVSVTLPEEAFQNTTYSCFKDGSFVRELGVQLQLYIPAAKDLLLLPSVPDAANAFT